MQKKDGHNNKDIAGLCESKNEFSWNAKDMNKDKELCRAFLMEVVSNLNKPKTQKFNFSARIKLSPAYLSFNISSKQG